jgi:hypothetical protein
VGTSLRIDAHAVREVFADHGMQNYSDGKMVSWETENRSIVLGNWFPGKPRTDLRAAKWPGRTSDGSRYERSKLFYA